jgi:hypothetical protein
MYCDVLLQKTLEGRLALTRLAGQVAEELQVYSGCQLQLIAGDFNANNSILHMHKHGFHDILADAPAHATDGRKDIDAIYANLAALQCALSVGVSPVQLRGTPHRAILLELSAEVQLRSEQHLLRPTALLTEPIRRTLLNGRLRNRWSMPQPCLRTRAGAWSMFCAVIPIPITAERTGQSLSHISLQDQEGKQADGKTTALPSWRI